MATYTTVCAVAALAVTFGGHHIAMAAPAPDGSSSGKSMGWLNHGLGIPYDEYCSVEQRRLDAEYSAAVARKTVDEIENEAKGVEQEIADLERRRRPYTEIDELRTKLRGIRLEQREWVEREAEIVRWGRTAPIVDCNEPDISKNRPPIWAGSPLPKNFVPANFRPNLPPDIALPVPPAYFCSEAERRAAAVKARLSNEYREAYERSRLRVDAAARYLRDLKDLQEDYASRNTVEDQRIIARIKREVDDYEKIYQLIRNYFRRIELTVVIFPGEEIMRVPINAKGDNCNQASTPASTAAGASRTPNNPTAPKQRGPAPATALNPAPAVIEKKCQSGGGLVGGIGEVECEIK